jgi:serine O-acetyltransferase
MLLEDAAAMHAAVPAADSVDEVILASPAFFAVACYRVAHVLHELGVPLLPRLVTAVGRRRSGIDIHPGAQIGHAFAIQHGTGIVIGETAEIGSRVRLYQGVTLGELRVERAPGDPKQHPTIEDDVVIYPNATILGGATLVGRGSVVGSHVCLTHSVPPGTVVTGMAPLERSLSGVEPEI